MSGTSTLNAGSGWVGSGDFIYFVGWVALGQKAGGLGRVGAAVA